MRYFLITLSIFTLAGFFFSPAASAAVSAADQKAQCEGVAIAAAAKFDIEVDLRNMDCPTALSAYRVNAAAEGRRWAEV